MIIPRPYQQAAVDAVYEHLRTKDNNPCVVLPTGCGKAVILAMIASDVVQKWNGRVLILAHVKELLEQNAGKVKMFCPDLKIGIYSAGLKSRDTDEQVIVAGIQSVHNKACELGAFDIIICDECHLLNSDLDDSMYKSFLNDMKIINPKVRVVGLTATPFRLKGGLICQPENILNEVCYEAGLKEMIQQGYLSPLVSRAGRSEAKLDDLHIRGGEFIGDEVAAAMDQEALVNSACREIIDLTRDRKSVLIFTSSVDHCRHVAETIERLSGKECAIVTGDTPAGERAEILDRFKGKTVPADLFGTPKPPLKFLANVNVLTTGFDAVNTDCVVLFRPTNSAGLLIQMCLDTQTEILTETGWKNWKNISQADNVAAFNMQTEAIEFCPIESHVERKLEPAEYMMEVSAPHLDIRISNQHDFVFHNRTRKNASWQKRAAEDLVQYKDSFYIPVAANADAKGIDLSDDEIRFLGWVLTDGCVDPKTLAVHITQSSESPYNEAIISMLNGCGFGYGKYQIPYKGNLVKYANRNDYCIPYGNPRGKNRGKIGWKKLFPYLMQRLLFSLKDISQRQLDILLESMNYANGWKPKNLAWKPKGYRISIGNHKCLADDLQAILIQRGYRCNMTIQKQKTSFHSGEPQTQYLLHVKKQNKATVGGANSKPSSLVKNRCSIKRSHSIAHERVWCVKNRLGTLVTRRNGKVAILGNCGRGTRLSPETGKQNCLVLDFGGNIMRHGPVDMISVTDRTPGNGDAPAKKCPSCLALIHAAYQKCPECGYDFPPPQKSNITEHASRDGIISGETFYDDYAVQDVFYCVHEKRYAEPGTPRTMRIDYQVGLSDFRSEWVCPEHTGYARDKFEKWWKNRAAYGCPIPETAQEAVRLANSGLLATPTTITVKTVAGEKFPRITKCIIGERPVMREPGDDTEDWPSNSPADLGVSQEDDLSEIPF